MLQSSRDRRDPYHRPIDSAPAISSNGTWAFDESSRRDAPSEAAAIDAELLGQGEYGWEFRLLDRGEFYAGRRFDLRAQAVAHGEEIRRELEADGWSAPDTRPIGGN